MDKVIVLASGGLDSTLCMIKLLKEGHTVVPVFSNYNQYSLEGEEKSVHRVVDWLGKDIDFRERKLHPVVEVKVDIGQRNAACPGRILAFVGAATIWAYTNNWSEGKIAIGIHMGDKDQDSCRVGYEGFLNDTLKSLTQDRMEIITPLMGLSREGIAEELHEAGIPWDILWNCYWFPSCGSQSTNMEYRCPGCRRKQLAMQSVGLLKPEWEVPNKSFSGRDIARRDWTKDL